MKLASNAFQPNGSIPIPYTCKGENRTPSLSITEIPAGAKSLALIMHDPDSPSGDWLHWMVWDIAPAPSIDLPEGGKFLGAMVGQNSFGNYSYGGPCPGSGTHHYIFDVFALNAILGFPATVSREELLKGINGHIMTVAQLVGTFSA